jgi:hypothetical protein
MTIEEEVIDLLEDNDITVYPGSIPTNGTYPNVVMQKISHPEIRSHQGIELEYPRFQLTCWGKTYQESVELAYLVVSIFNLNQVDFKLATKEGELDVKETEVSLYRRILDFYIWY